MAAGTFRSRSGSAPMTPLVRFLLVNTAGGFAIGLLAGLAFMQSNEEIDLIGGQPLAAAMTLWAFAASFAMGAVGTGLALLPYE